MHDAVSEKFKGVTCGIITAHAMHTIAGRGGCGAQKHSLNRRFVRGAAHDWAGDQLPKIGEAAIDIATDEVRVAIFRRRAIAHMLRENTVSKTRRTPLDLGLDARGHIQGGTVGNVAIRPGSMFALRCAGWVEQAVLGHEHKGFRAVVAFGNLLFALGDFLQRSADMHRSGAPARSSAPMNWGSEREVHFENSRPYLHRVRACVLTWPASCKVQFAMTSRRACQFHDGGWEKMNKFCLGRIQNIDF